MAAAVETRRAPARPSPGDRAALYGYYEAVFEGVEAPFAFVDLDAMWANGDDMLRRAAGKPVRVASKSIRCRALLGAILDRSPGFRGVMAFTLPEALWLAGQGFDDLLVAYPATDRAAIAELAGLRATDGEGGPKIALMVDSAAHLDLIEAAVGDAGGGPIRVCVEIDTGFWVLGGRVKIGPKRSPVRTPAAAEALAREIASRGRLRLAGLMAYEGHIAGVGDRPPGKRLRGAVIRAMQRASAREIRGRRARIVAAVSRVAELEFVNGGGTGSIERTAAEDAVTEVAAGSGFYAPALFDDYSAFALEPAAIFALPVSRRPGPGVATALGGGYLASGVGARDRQPRPCLPPGLRLDPMEGAGEVQTPLLGAAAGRLRVGDRVYLRHAKAGELCERFESLYLVEDGRIAGQVPTYRGEGKAFL